MRLARRIFFIFLALFLSIQGVRCSFPASPPVMTTAIPVFPGAQGFGVMTPAGRGGKILKVTTLDDHGPGSLRAALEASGPRFVVFEVSGTVQLQSGNLEVNHPFLTLAGQTSPSPGITVRGGHLSIRTHDVLVQHLRFRVGDDPEGSERSGRDGIQIDGSEAYNVIVDHCSVSWAIDENIGINGGARDILVSNCIVSEGLRRSFNKKGSHSKGILIGEKCRVALVGNLLAHNDDRHPNIKGGSEVLMLNNFNYNAGIRWVPISDDENSGPIELVSVGNVYKGGPNTSAKVIFNIHKSVVNGTQLHLHDNMHSSRQLISNDAYISQSMPVWLSSMKILPSQVVEMQILEQAGARPRDRDEVDRRIVREAKDGTGGLIDSPAQVGGWPELTKNYRPFPVPQDPHADLDGNGYSVIEEVLQGMARELE